MSRPEAERPAGEAAPARFALLRSTALRLLLAFLLAFLAVAAGAILYVSRSAREALEAQALQALEVEAAALDDAFEEGGLRRLAEAIEARGRRPGAGLYLLANFAGEPIAGNVVDLPPGTLQGAGVREASYQVEGEAGLVNGRALVRVSSLPAGVRLLVGRDLAERERLDRATRAATWSAVTLVTAFGTLGAFAVTRRLLARVDALSARARTLMSGDLGGGGDLGERLPVHGYGDEFDRLALSLNAMLDRIVALMAGVREVSDNVAHDLRTPLTRLRQRAEGALAAGAALDGSARAALEAIIMEADELIRLFDALLLIARAEAGAGRDAMRPLDVAAVAREIGELYEPAAEEAGVPLLIEADAPAHAVGHRELIGRMVANLLDNAIKHARPEGAEGASPGSNDAASAAIRLTVRAAEPSGVEIAVEDRGPGIPEADRERVLARFVRLEPSRSKPGSGLGLALVAAITRLHGGRVLLEDTAPGLRVRVVLPAGAPAAGAA